MTNDHLRALIKSVQADVSPFRNYLVDLYQRYLPLKEGQRVSNLTALAPPDGFAICAVTLDGQTLEVGDRKQTFTLQALTRALIYGLALEDRGRQQVTRRVGGKPYSDQNNAIALDETDHCVHNPIITAGAITTTSLIQGCNQAERLSRVLDMFQRYTGRPLAVDARAFSTLKTRGHRERAIAHFLQSFDLLEGTVDDTLDLFFQHSTLLVTSRDLAMMGATLANGGINPVTQAQALAADYVPDVTSVIMSCGLDERSGEWLRRVGIPAQTATSGGLLAVVPQKLGLGIFSPYLDPWGNSIRAMQVCEAIAHDHHLHLFDIYASNQQMLQYIEQVNKITAAAAALEQNSYDPNLLKDVGQRADELGQLARMFERMAAQVKVREQHLQQQIQTLRIEIDKTTKDQKVAEIVQSESFHHLKQKLDRMKQRRDQRGASTN